MGNVPGAYPLRHVGEVEEFFNFRLNAAQYSGFDALDIFLDQLRVASCACAGSRRRAEVRFGQQEGWIDRRRLLPVCILKRQRVLYGSPLHPDPSLAVLMHVLRGDIGALLAKPVDQAVFGLLWYFGPLDPVDGKTRITKPFEMENEPLDRLP